MTIRWARIDSFDGNFHSPEATFWRPCPVCGSNRSESVLVYRDFQFYTDSSSVPKRVDVRTNQCLDCLALFLNPCYSNLGLQALFAEAGLSYGIGEGRFDEQVEWMERRGLLAPGIRVLDIGCYDGAFLARIPRGIRKVGVDIDGPAIRRGRIRYAAEGIEFLQADFEAISRDEAPDLITIVMVLEHLPRPAEVLRRLRTVAGSDTRLMVEVPLLENGITNDICGFFSAHHMTHFSRSSLSNCLSGSGWHIVDRQDQEDYNGCRVLAVPCEGAEAVSGDPRDTVSLRGLLGARKEALSAVDRVLTGVKDFDRCVIWGGGTHTEFLYHTTGLFTHNPAREYAILDGDPLKQGKTWRGIPIHAPSMVAGVEWSKVCLVVSSYGSQEKIVRSALDRGVPMERIVRLYEAIRVR